MTSLDNSSDTQIMVSEENFKSDFDVKVSVVVPAYNTEKYIARCLDSLINQTLKEIEIVVVDDGSEDNTAKIVGDYVSKDSRIKFVTQSHKKQGAARNLGTSMSTGEYIGYVDSDDWVDLDYYEKLYNSAKKYNSDIAIAANVRIGNGKTKKRLEFTEEKFVTSLQDKIDIGKQAKNPCPTNKIYRREMLQNNKVCWPEGCFCEDKLFTIKAVYYANGIVTVPEIKYYYYRNMHSTVKTKRKQHIMTLEYDKNNARKAVLDFLKEHNADIRDKEFWAITEKKEIFGITIFTKKESLHTKKYYIFGFIKIAQFTSK